jgi:hypothetical protein
MYDDFHLCENLRKPREDCLFMKLITVELEPLDEFLDGTFGLERKQREAEGNISPLPRII